MKHYKLFIDETGHPHANHHSSHFALIGIIIEDGKQEELKIRADQIRFKYWGRTNVVFHSEDIGRNAGDFQIFAKDKHLAKNFERDLLNFLLTCPVAITVASINKVHAYAIGWKEDTIITTASERVIMDFMAFIYGQSEAQGRLVYETSGSTRDTLYLRAFHRYLDPNWEKQHKDFKDVREHITSLTFASKLNHDTEMQLADLLSYASVCKHKQSTGVKDFDTDSYEYKMIQLLDKKLLKMPTSVTKAKKKKYYSQIQGLSYLPKPMPKKKQKKKTA